MSALLTVTSVISRTLEPEITGYGVQVTMKSSAVTLLVLSVLTGMHFASGQLVLGQVTRAPTDRRLAV